MFAFVSAGADTKANTSGGGALEAGDLCLLEDGGERGGALVSDVVISETADEGRGGDGERVDVSMGADKKANLEWLTREWALWCGGGKAG